MDDEDDGIDLDTSSPPSPMEGEGVPQAPAPNVADGDGDSTMTDAVVIRDMGRRWIQFSSNVSDGTVSSLVDLGKYHLKETAKENAAKRAAQEAQAVREMAQADAARAAQTAKEDADRKLAFLAEMRHHPEFEIKKALYAQAFPDAPPLVLAAPAPALAPVPVAPIPIPVPAPAPAVPIVVPTAAEGAQVPPLAGGGDDDKHDGVMSDDDDEDDEVDEEDGDYVPEGVPVPVAPRKRSNRERRATPRFSPECDGAYPYSPAPRAPRAPPTAASVASAMHHVPCAIPRSAYELVRAAGLYPHALNNEGVMHSSALGWLLREHYRSHKHIRRSTPLKRKTRRGRRSGVYEYAQWECDLLKPAIDSYVCQYR